MRQNPIAGLVRELDGALPTEELFDELPNVVFFLKDLAGRYVAVNKALVERCSVANKSALIGRLPTEVFPSELGTRYQRQDQTVLRTGRPVVNRLELHLYKGRRPGGGASPRSARCGGAMASSAASSVCRAMCMSPDKNPPSMRSSRRCSISCTRLFRPSCASAIWRNARGYRRINSISACDG